MSRREPSATTIAVHGGAGDPPRGRVYDERRHHDALAAAIAAADAALRGGGAALDAAQAAVAVLEDSPLFNAGRGSVLNADGRAEMDAALMCGATARAGAVAAVTTPRHPIEAARAVMDHSPHVLLAGAGADAFAARQQIELADHDWFATERQRDRWRSGGTVGAVVRDAAGGLAAATSTGGVSGQLAGRVGDSPLIGAGTWADDVCAVSCTGDGERLIVLAAAYEVAARIRHRGEPLAEAGKAVVARLTALGGRGGLIAVDAAGNVAMPFGSALMARGVKRGDGEAQTRLWPDAPIGPRQ